ncbi:MULTISPECIES: VOC family protein [Gordonia]|uniref:Lactoylglutathione lyase-related lyase n=1 Tax=Gordonia terrae C-6 TaxID=1316928 RepID=R7Y7M0_9ACTN|nr:MULTISPECIES: VOC family protein [Gordonia]AFR51004.1 Lactoylglutathione lyase-related lyase [Gordonia sp. KTR9]EON32000.1 Lactoylglutathione lyase-related lyase [Gordonia terrae C-6]
MLYSQLPVLTDRPVCRLRSLRSVTLSVPDPLASRDFYHEVWGLSTVEEDGDRFWLRATGTEHHVLNLRRGDANALGGFSFALGTPREVDDAARALDRIGVPLLREPGPLDDAGGGYGLALVDPEGRTVELSADVHAVSSQEPAGRRAIPRKIAHVVLNTTDIERITAFYTQVLGMRVSDWSERQMSFLRCNSEHHVIALNQAAWPALNHVAYEMTSIDHFMRGIGNLRSHGIAPQWGPGRHGPGDNTFSYFTDPAGLVCEYTSEVAQIDEDAWLCRTWRRTPELSDQWGTAGPPTTAVRSAMAGIPDHGASSLVTPRDPDYFIHLPETVGVA